MSFWSTLSRLVPPNNRLHTRCSAQVGPQRVPPQALCAELHIGSAGDLLGAPKVALQLPGGGAAEGQPAGVALLLSSGSVSVEGKQVGRLCVTAAAE